MEEFSIPFLKSSIPFWHLPYYNFRSVPFSTHSIPCTVYEYIMHRAGQRCFELLALIGSPQLPYQRCYSAGQDSWPAGPTLRGCTVAEGF